MRGFFIFTIGATVLMAVVGVVSVVLALARLM